jgi:transcriptional regulator with GAF, ATPase, and Fis domain
VADGGTIFLDEVGELPLQTQVRLLRVLESGEFMKVGSSQVQKTNVRIVAATNVNMMKAIHDGRFREDLVLPSEYRTDRYAPLRERKGDIHLLFRKFAMILQKNTECRNWNWIQVLFIILKIIHFPGMSDS